MSPLDKLSELIAYGQKKRPVSLPGATGGIFDEIRYSRREETPMDIKFCGKALDDFKLHLPSRLKKRSGIDCKNPWSDGIKLREEDVCHATSERASPYRLAERNRQNSS